MGLVGILLVAWSIDWVFVSRIWPDGLDRLRSMLADDLGHGIMLAARQGRGAGEITGPANFLYGVVFEATGIHDMGQRFANGTALSIPDTVVRRSYLANREAIETAMVGTPLLGVRFAILIRFLPLLLLLYAVGTVDGLTERAIRRSCGGRESASLYHRAKYLQMVVLGLGGVVLLVWPQPVAWELWAGVIVMATGAWRGSSVRFTRSICRRTAKCKRSQGSIRALVIAWRRQLEAQNLSSASIRRKLAALVVCFPVGVRFKVMWLKTRTDRGQSKIAAPNQEAVLAAKRDNPRRSIRQIKRLLETAGVMALEVQLRSAIHRLLQQHAVSRIRGSVSGVQEKRSFTAQYAGSVWYGDVLHGPQVRFKGRLRKTYLVSLFDDAARLVAHSAIGRSDLGNRPKGVTVGNRFDRPVRLNGRPPLRARGIELLTEAGVDVATEVNPRRSCFRFRAGLRSITSPR